MLATIRWRTLAAHLPKDVTEDILDNDEMVWVLDIVEDLLRERDEWVEPHSEEYHELEHENKMTGAEAMQESVLAVVSDLVHRQKMFGFETTLEDVEDKLKMLDPLKEIRRDK